MAAPPLNPAPLKPILSSGLGHYASSDPNGIAAFGPDASAKAQEMLARAKRDAEESGFELVLSDANPADPEDTMRRFTGALRGREFVAVNVGFGLRGHKEHSALFERMVNEAWKIRPGIKILFSSGPYDIINCIKRNDL